MKQKRLTWLRYYILSFFVPQDLDTINVGEEWFLWIDPGSGDIVKDVLTILYLTISKLCPNVRIHQHLQGVEVIESANIPKRLWVWHAQMARNSAVQMEPTKHKVQGFL